MKAVNSHKMRTAMAVLILLVLVAGIGWPASAEVVVPPPGVAGPDLTAEYKPGELLVKFGPAVSAASARSAMQGYQAEYVRTLYGGDVEVWQVPEGSELQIMEQLNAEPFIEYAEPNYRIYAFDTVPNDPSFNKQWAHTWIDSPAAWDVSTGSAAVTVAILDTGIDPAHPDLTGKIVAGYDFVGGDSNPRDENGHGTHVAGIAAAMTNNGVGVAGVDWQAQIMPVRILDREGGGYVSEMVSGIDWARDHGADVVNLSLGGPFYNASAQIAINQAYSSGVLVVASMGNRGDGTTLYPAAYNHVLAVAATDRFDSRTAYSSYGNHCDVAAPGGYMTYYHDSGGIYSTLPTYPVYMTTVESFYNNYDYVMGTSQAAPYVSGLAALLWSVAPTLSPDEVEAAIETTAVDKGTPGWDPYYGHGRIDAAAALEPYGAPQAPVLDAINNGGANDYVVDWSEPARADSYTLQEDDYPSFPSPTTLYNGSVSQFSITGQEGGTWYYRVRASNSQGDSPWSNVRLVHVRPKPPSLDPISNPGNEDEYQITWSPSVSASGYELQQKSSVESWGEAKVRYRGTALQYNVTGQPGGTWEYRVIAYSGVGDSLPSNTEDTTVTDPGLAQPTLSPIDNEDGDGDYSVEWQAVTGATSYVLEESRNPYFVAPTELYSGPDLLYAVTGRQEGTWHYRVRALGPGGQSPWSEPEAAVVPAWAYFPLLLKNYDPPGVKNGGFEAGLTAWSEYSSNGYEVIVSTDSYPDLISHNGKWLAWLGGVLNEVAWIEQEMVVPTGAPYLHYWHWIWSEDTCGFDAASVWVDGGMVETYALCGLQNTGGYVEHVVDLAAYAGQPIQLRIRVETDAHFHSSLFIDDVSFQTGALAEQSVHQGTSEPGSIPSKGAQSVPSDVEP
jgi:subtilisin family serine protease